MNILILLSVMAIPPPNSSTIEELNSLPNKEKSVIQADAEYKAPIPDSLKDRFEILKTDSGIEIKLEIPEKKELERLPGPSWRWPHSGCYMCLGNYLVIHYGQSKSYLDEIGYQKWGILWDNLHNDPKYEGVKGSGEEYYGGYSYGRRGFFGRLFRRR